MALPAVRDLGVAAALLVIVLAGTVLAAGLQPGFAGVGWVAVLCAVVASAACAWRAAAPVVCVLVVAVVVGAYLALEQPYGPIQLLVTLAGAEMGRRRPSWRALAVGVVASVLVGAGFAARPAVVARADAFDSPIAAAVLLVAWPSVFVIVPVLVGALLRARALSVARGREELLARGAAEERMRVAREVHDVAGHGFAVVAMQAGVALTVLDEDLAQARLSLEAVRDTAQHALAELHKTLEAMRAEPRDLRQLIERVRRAGVPVELRVEGDPEALGGAVAGGVHRVVQEALTNVVRHAGPTSAAVEVTGGREALTVVVRDQGTGSAAPGDGAVGTGRGGSGLEGLRARVEELGGSFRAGARSAGGFEVVARFPGADR